MKATGTQLIVPLGPPTTETYVCDSFRLQSICTCLSGDRGATEVPGHAVLMCVSAQADDKLELSERCGAVLGAYI